jgi:hypothetical protein
MINALQKGFNGEAARTSKSTTLYQAWATSETASALTTSQIAMSIDGAALADLAKTMTNSDIFNKYFFLLIPQNPC